MIEKIVENYSLTVDNVTGNIEIKKKSKELPLLYELKLPALEKGTLALLDKVRENLVAHVPIKTSELLDIAATEPIKDKFYAQGLEVIKSELPNIDEKVQNHLIGLIIHEMLGLGKLEMLLADGRLEEIAINGASDPVWVYHKKYGWLKTNIIVPSELEIVNYAMSIGRRVGRQITVLNPLMDAHLITGDRVNATLFPISTRGNTLTIRKFRRSPWTITDFIENKTISPDVAALLWLGIQYEMNAIVAGGTASGKTSFLNALTPFIPSNQRIITIEDTRELTLPKFLHWIPLTTREPNPEGKGEITMLQLLVNSLRMRPDRIILGEIRRAREAEVLFEAMHTGHSVYATIHAYTAEQTYRRLINPPINVPEMMLEALNLITVCFRDRRLGIRRIFQVAELIPPERGGNNASLNVIFRWKADEDVIEQYAEIYRMFEELHMHTGMTKSEIASDLKDKVKILEWLEKNKVNTVDSIGKIISEYYSEPESILDLANKNKKPDLGGEIKRE